MNIFLKFLKFLLRVSWFVVKLPFAYMRFTLAGDDRVAFSSIPLVYRDNGDTVRAALQRLDYTEPAPAPAMSGGGMQSIRWRHVLFEGFGAGGGRKLEVPDSDRALLIGSGFGFSQVGLVLLKWRRWRVYPLAGFGGMGGSIVPATKNDNTPGGLDLNQKAAVDTGGGPVINLGMGADFRLGKRFGLVLGMRAGMIVPLAAPDERRYYAHLTHGPVLSRKQADDTTEPSETEEADAGA